MLPNATLLIDKIYKFENNNECNEESRFSSASEITPWEGQLAEFYPPSNYYLKIIYFIDSIYLIIKNIYYFNLCQ